MSEEYESMRLHNVEGCDAGLLDDLFGRVARHLIKQSAKAKGSGGGCRYLAEDGKQCAVGCLIRPDAYVATMEGSEVDSDEVLRVLEQSGIATAHRAVRELLRLLQRVHDHEAVADWASALSHIAADNGFEMPC